MCCCSVDDCLVELDDRTGLTLVEFALDCEFTLVSQCLHMLRHLVEINVKAYAKHAFLGLNLLE